MSKWKNKSVNLGEISANVKITIIFEAKEKLDIQRITSSCGCSVPKYDKEKNVIVVSYTPSSVPYHLKSRGDYHTTKNITVYYNDGTKDVLYFKAKIK